MRCAGRDMESTHSTKRTHPLRNERTADATPGPCGTQTSAACRKSNSSRSRARGLEIRVAVELALVEALQRPALGDRPAPVPEAAGAGARAGQGRSADGGRPGATRQTWDAEEYRPQLSMTRSCDRAN